MSAVISLGRQIAEVERELAKRRQVFPGLVARGNMRQSVADFYMGDMQAVLATLKWCAENRDLIVKLKAENTRLRAELEGMPGDSKCSNHLCPDCDHTQK